MKNRRINNLCFLIFTALALIGCLPCLTAYRSAGAAAINPAQAAPTLAQQASLTAGDAAATELFGASAAIDGDTAVVGAPNDDTAAGADAGSAYVFVRSGASWSQQAKLTGSMSEAGDSFGAAVGISGDTIVVGAPFATNDSADLGQVYVFVRSGTSWSQQAALTVSGAGDGLFGQAVAIDGDTIVAGAPFNDSAAGDGGSAFVFARSGTSWSQQAQLTAGDAAAGDQLGSGVAIDGDLAVIAAPFTDSAESGADVGAAYVFARSGTSWSQEIKLFPAVPQENGFFSLNSVAISGATVVVGDQASDTAAGADVGEVTVFVRQAAGSWTREATLAAGDAAAGDIFGAGVSISGDTLVVGAPFDDTAAGADAGSAYVFSRSGTTWTQRQKLSASDAAAGDGFGNAVSISGDSVVAGAFFDDTAAGADTGSAYVFAPGAAPPPPTGDRYADAVSSSILTLNPANAVGAPNGNLATVTSVLSIGSLVLDMGAGEEGTGDLKVHYGGLSAEVATTVDFMDAAGRVIGSGQLRLINIGAGGVTVVPYSAAPTPYRFVRLRGKLLASFGVDAVEAVSVVSP
jgi:FG-GAP repeat protein